MNVKPWVVVQKENCSVWQTISFPSLMFSLAKHVLIDSLDILLARSKNAHLHMLWLQKLQNHYVQKSPPRFLVTLKFEGGCNSSSFKKMPYFKSIKDCCHWGNSIPIGWLDQTRRCTSFARETHVRNNKGCPSTPSRGDNSTNAAATIFWSAEKREEGTAETITLTDRGPSRSITSLHSQRRILHTPSYTTLRSSKAPAEHGRHVSGYK